MYQYKAIITAIYDGDTVTVDISLGLGVWVRGEKLRLYGINAPEVRGDSRIRGIASRDWLRNIALGKEVTLITIKDKKGKYGRYLAKISLLDDARTLNDMIVGAGHAIYKEY